MQLTSLGFLFVLLPVGGLIYYFLRGAGRRRFLLGYSLLFVGLLSPLCLLLLLAVMIPDYLLAQYIAMAHPRARLDPAGLRHQGHLSGSGLFYPYRTG